VGVLAVAACLVLAAPAAADDQRVLAAYNGHHDSLHAAVKKITRSLKKATPKIRDGKVPRTLMKRAIDGARDGRRVLAKVRDELEAAQPSSAAGARAKTFGLAEIKSDRRTFRRIIRGSLALLHDHWKRAATLFMRAADDNKEAKKYAKRAHKAFRDAGLKPAHTGVGDGA
jgi:hypothetical protein